MPLPQLKPTFCSLLMMTAPQQYGRRLIPHIVDDLARSDPDRVVYSFPKSSDVSEGFRDVSARELAHAVDKVAWWLHNEIGRSSSFETIGYIGPRKSSESITAEYGLIGN